MKRSLIIKACFAIAAFAFTSSLLLAQTKFGITAGGNVSSISSKPSSTINTTGGIVGYQAGFFISKRIKKFSIVPEFLVISKGGKIEVIYSSPQGATNLKSVDQLTYAQLPLTVYYTLPFKKSNVLVGGGGYYALALNGNEKSNGLLFGAAVNSQERDLNFGEGNFFSKSDAGLRACVSSTVGRFNFTLSQDWGLTNLLASSNGYPEMHSRALQLSLAFNFFK